MRLAGQAKAGFYPTPPDELTEQILPLIKPQDPNIYVNICDPCAGEGLMLTAIRDHLTQVTPDGSYAVEPSHVRIFATELDKERADKAKLNLLMQRVIEGDAFDMRYDQESMTVLALNPPYDWRAESGEKDKRQTRAEYQFLRYYTPILQPGGILIYIVPFSLLGRKAAMAYLGNQYENITLGRFMDHNNGFKQVVFVATRRYEETNEPHIGRAINRIFTDLDDWSTLPTLNEQRHPKYIVPNAMLQTVTYRLNTPEPEEVDEVINTTLIPQLFHDVNTRRENHKLRMAMPPLAGHLHNLLGLGVINGSLVDLEGEKAIIKGVVRIDKTVTTSVDDVTADSDRAARQSKIKTRTAYTDTPVQQINILTESGELRELEQNEVGPFISRHMTTIAETIQKETNPIYTFDNHNGFGPAILKLNPKRKIPNTDKTGLMAAQQHAIAACATVLQENPAVALIGQMGVGKTLKGAGIASALHSHGQFQRGIIICPPHLVGKWKAEIRLTWPECKAITLNSPGDIARLFREEGPILGVMKMTSSSLGPAKEHTYWAGGPVRAEFRAQKDLPKMIDNPYPWAGLSDPKSIVGMKVHRRSNKRIRDEQHAMKLMRWLDKRGIACPTCGHKMEDSDQATNAPSTSEWYCPNCHQPLYGTNGYRFRRVALADVVRVYARRYGPVDLTITDEVHKVKGVTGRGKAFATIAANSKRNAGMTGTLYQGRASTVFWIFWRLSPSFRKRWIRPGRTGQARIGHLDFSKANGLFEEVITETETVQVTTKTSRTRQSPKEIPGLQPEILREMLDMCVFVELSHLGYALPAYVESDKILEMTPELLAEYQRIEAELYKAMTQALAKGDKGLLARYHRSMLSWPEIPSRQISVYDRDGNHIVTSNPYPGHIRTPKEVAVIDHIKRETGKGRGVMLYIQMTDTTDITPRWVSMIREEGISVKVCRIGTEKREEWFDEQARLGTQVIITHPRRVETGLDLLAWPEMIFLHDMSYEAAMIEQAAARSWRIGQTQPVNVTRYTYAETTQQDNLMSILTKMVSGRQVNGRIPDERILKLIGAAGNDLEMAMMNEVRKRIERNKKIRDIRTHRKELESGNRNGPMAMAFRELAHMSQEAALAALDRKLDEITEEVEQEREAIRLLADSRNSEVEEIRSGNVGVIDPTADLYTKPITVSEELQREVDAYIAKQQAIEDAVFYPVDDEDTEYESFDDEDEESQKENNGASDTMTIRDVAEASPNVLIVHPAPLEISDANESEASEEIGDVSDTTPADAGASDTPESNKEVLQPAPAEDKPKEVEQVTKPEKGREYVINWKDEYLSIQSRATPLEHLQDMKSGRKQPRIKVYKSPLSADIPRGDYLAVEESRATGQTWLYRLVPAESDIVPEEILVENDPLGLTGIVLHTPGSLYPKSKITNLRWLLVLQE